jgi:hypothetical protein
MAPVAAGKAGFEKKSVYVAMNRIEEYEAGAHIITVIPSNVN